MKRLKAFISVAIVFSLQAMVVCSAALASSAEGGEHGGANPMEYVWKIVNFAILVFILVKFGGKPLKNFLRARTEAIQKSLDESRQARELAQRALDEVQEKLKTKDSEIESVIAAARASGEKEREALIAEGQRTSEKLLEQARSNIDFELNQAREAIKAEAVEVAMELAQKKLQEKLSESDRKRLFEEALSKLEGRN